MALLCWQGLARVGAFLWLSLLVRCVFVPGAEYAMTTFRMQTLVVRPAFLYELELLMKLGPLTVEPLMLRLQFELR